MTLVPERGRLGSHPWWAVLGVRAGESRQLCGCLFWLALIELGASNISIPFPWLKSKGSRLNNKKEHAGIFVDTHTHTKAHSHYIIVPKKGFDKNTQKQEMQKLKQLRLNVELDREIILINIEYLIKYIYNCVAELLFRGGL